jgi:Interferon-induced transmembrane protein
MSQPPEYPPPPQYPPPPPPGSGGYSSGSEGGYPGGGSGDYSSGGSSSYPPPGGPGGYPGGYGGYPQGPKPNSYLVWAILTTLFCCLPFGIVSIVQAAKVDSLWTAGDYAGAQAASNSAKKWAIIAACVGVALGVLYAIIAFAGVYSVSSNGR